ncbi:MAG: hypothetical protein U0136_05925 [Bdellovibrionota bacterium]
MRRNALRVAVLLAVGAAAILAARTRHQEEILFTLVVTDKGTPVRFINLGESRWSGAAYSVFAEDSHDAPLASADSGDPVQVRPGRYDLEVSWSDGQHVRQRWMEHLEIKRSMLQTFELNLPTGELGTQKLENTWQP